MARRQSTILDKNKLILHERKGPFHSTKTLGEFWVFYWYDVETGQLYSTHVDNTMANYRAWRELCLSKDPWGVYEGLAESPRRSKNTDYPVISADGRPERWLKISEQASQEVIELDINQKSDPTVFHQLFA